MIEFFRRRVVRFLVAFVLLWGAAFLWIPRFGPGVHPGAQGSAAIHSLQRIAAARTPLAGTDGLHVALDERTTAQRVREEVPWFADFTGTVRSGYRFRLVPLDDVPATSGASSIGTTQEARRGDGAPAAVEGAASAPSTFVVHAWPESEATLDDRVFVLDARGSLWFHHDESARYRGAKHAPPERWGTTLDAERMRVESGVAWTHVPEPSEHTPRR
ncbi:MAG: hypothetical protein IPJ77_09540 [Planctomycetes bacterium]|nr:hypothetical protein [Planctomycetota bacterium]